MKCAICKSFNARRECGVHPNLTTYLNFKNQLQRLIDKDPKAIDSICDEHRNPLQFNTCILNLAESVPLIAELCNQGIPMSALPKDKRIEL